MAKNKYVLFEKDEYGHWTMNSKISSAINSKKEIVDLLERTKDWQGAKSIKNIDRGDFLDVQVTWANKLTGEDETSTFSYKWMKVDGTVEDGA